MIRVFIFSDIVFFFFFSANFRERATHVRVYTFSACKSFVFVFAGLAGTVLLSTRPDSSRYRGGGQEWKGAVVFWKYDFSLIDWCAATKRAGLFSRPKRIFRPRYRAGLRHRFEKVLYAVNSEFHRRIHYGKVELFCGWKSSVQNLCTTLFAIVKLCSNNGYHLTRLQNHLITLKKSKRLRFASKRFHAKGRFQSETRFFFTFYSIAYGMFEYLTAMATTEFNVIKWNKRLEVQANIFRI